MLTLMTISDRVVNCRTSNMLDRELKLHNLLKKSFFLFGPRATGKSTLIKQQLGDLV